jgi:hypothetical protein
MDLKVTDADSIILELEESTGDTKTMQTSLSSGFAYHEWTQDDLDAEFELIMSDDALCPCVLSKPKPSKLQTPLTTEDTDCTGVQRAEPASGLLPENDDDDPLSA